MLVLSAGMPKSGTAWYFNMTNDLLVASGHADARTIREKFFLKSVLHNNNCRLSDPTYLNMARLCLPHLFGQTYTVKTHSGPTDAIRKFMTYPSVMKVTYIYRDPRDVVLSALDHGERARTHGKTNVTFAKLDSMQDAVKNAKRWISTWERWTQMEHILVVRYEDLVANTIGELQRLAEFLNIEASPETLSQIAAVYQPSSPEFRGSTAINYNKGVIGRYQSVMSDQDLALCRKFFGDYPERMGYAGW